MRSYTSSIADEAQVKGTVAEVKTDGPLNIESKGKTVSKTGDSKDAAVRRRSLSGALTKHSRSI